ncbi:MAG TPA: hypothetical protein VI776_16120 [Anaerolineales bacterium]|nr:hypothetical protein [Anaerolineales bacterium]
MTGSDGLAPSEGAPSEGVFWEAILANQLQRYPLLEVRDLYKLAYQAALGSEHADPDPAAARARLEEEIAGLDLGSAGPCPAEPRFDPISPDGAVLRVYLRSYLASGGDLESLLQAFLQTAKSHRGSLETLPTYWGWSVQLAAQGFLPLNPGEMERFLEAMREQGFPAVKHSPAYEQAYRPAYRVVLAELLL